MDFFAEIKKRYTHELRNNIVPFWDQHSIDRSNGSFITCLDRYGNCYDPTKQMWMQYRMCYMYAALYNRFDHNHEHLQTAQNAWNFLQKHAVMPDGRLYYKLNADGEAMALAGDNGSEIFSASFAALAAAELYGATLDEEYKIAAEKFLHLFLSDTAAAESAAPALPGIKPVRRLAYRLIALNVLNTMNQYKIGNYGAAAERMAREMLEFAEPERGIWMECQNSDKTFDFSSQANRMVIPGHSLEGIWFALQSPAAADKKFVEQLARAALTMLEYGWDAENDGIIYYCDRCGYPPVRGDYILKAWWSQCEAALAALMLYQKTGKREFLEWFKKLDEYMFNTFRDPEYMEWFCYAPLNGKVLHGYKGSNFKAMFHIPRFLLECINISE